MNENVSCVDSWIHKIIVGTKPKESSILVLKCLHALHPVDRTKVIIILEANIALSRV